MEGFKLIVFFLIGLISVILLLSLKQKILAARRKGIALQKLENLHWFQNHWYAGISLFVGNMIIFFVTILLIFLFSFIPIPFLHVVIFLLATLTSIYLWSVINVAFNGTKMNRLKLGIIGSFFYVFVSLNLLFELLGVNINNADETMSQAILGLLIGIMINGFAFITCFVYTGFSKSDSN